MNAAHARFWAKVDTSGDCWLWTGSRTRTGYGRFALTLTDGSRIVRRAHRISYASLVGPVPDGMELDHLCRNRACIKPAHHLEPVTHLENVRRGAKATATHCQRGHEFSTENTRISQGRRKCRTCERARAAA